MHLFEIYKAGGPYMNLISIWAVVTLLLTVYKIVTIVNKKGINQKFINLILMSGALALAFGFLSQIVGITEALVAIREAADISPQIVLEGALISFYAPIWGFIVFIFSIFVYFILKEIVKVKKTG